MILCSKSGKEGIWTLASCTLIESWICTQVNYQQQRQWEIHGQQTSTALLLALLKLEPENPVRAVAWDRE